MKQKQMKGVCLLIAGILFLLLFFSFSGIEKTKLLDTDGRNFEKAEVTNVISGNLSNSGSGKQTVELKLLSGDHKGKIIQATSSQSYLFGAKCKKGMKKYRFWRRQRETGRPDGFNAFRHALAAQMGQFCVKGGVSRVKGRCRGRKNVVQSSCKGGA